MKSKAAYTGNVYQSASRMTQRNAPDSFCIPICWWPLLFACFMTLVLCAAGGADLGVYGEENAFRQLCVSVAWVSIPLGVLSSIAGGFFIVTERGRGWEALALWLCCLAGFPVYALLVMFLFC